MTTGASSKEAGIFNLCNFVVDFYSYTAFNLALPNKNESEERDAGLVATKMVQHPPIGRAVYG